MLQGLLQQFHFLADTCTSGTFFLLPTWYEYLVKAGRMGIDPQTKTCGLLGDFNYSDLSLIGLAVLDILLRIGGMVAIGYIMIKQVMPSQRSSMRLSAWALLLLLPLSSRL